MQECEELVSKGITGTGQGFDASGKRLGGFTRQPPLSVLRQTAAAAAAKRARIGALLPSGPRRLGGDSEIMTALTPIQAAAMAAERRMHDDLWCGSGCQENLTAVENENGKLEYSTFEDLGESSKNTNVSQGKHHVSRDSCNSDKGQSSSYTNSQNVSTFVKGTSGAHVFSGSSSCGRIDDAEDKVIWECSMCTLFNQVFSLLLQSFPLFGNTSSIKFIYFWPV